MIKAVFLDVDGTLTSLETRAIPESAIKAISMARQNGVKIFIATGRHTLMPQERGLISDMEFDGYVAINGQLCHLHDNTPVFTLPLDAGDARLVLDACDRCNFPCLMVGLDKMGVTAKTARVEEFHRMVDIEVPPVISAAEFGSDQIFSLMPYVDTDEEPLVLAGLKNSTSARWSALATDIIPAESGKEKGIEIFLNRFNIKREECMACGDGDNDISMIRYAGVGVAMCTGRPGAISAADFVAPAPIDDGLYYTFKKFNII